MQRRSSLGSVRQKAPGVWEVRCCKGRDAQGRRIYRKKVVRGSRRDADAALAKMLVLAGDGDAAGRMTVGDYFEGVYLPWCEGRLRPDTVAGYRCDVRVHIAPGLGHVPLADLEPLAVEGWLAGIERAGARRSAYKTLRQGLRQARRWKLVRDVATDAVPEPRAAHYEPRVLSAEEAAALLAAFRGDRVEAAVLLSLGCGLRRSEVCGLDWEDVDLAAAEVTVRHSYVVTDGVGHLGEPKTARSRRVVSIPDGFARRLAEIRPAMASGPVLVGEQGGRMNPDVLTNLYDVRAREGGVRWTAFRNLRHSHATIMLDAGVDVVSVSRRLGHASVATTDAFYLRPRRAADQRAADAFDSLGLA